MGMAFVGLKTTLDGEISSLNEEVGDLHFRSDGTLDVLTNESTLEKKRAAAQGIKERLSMHKGEYFLNLLEGIPYFTNILGKGRSLAVIKAIITQAIFSYPGVVSVRLLRTEQNTTNRSLTIEFVAQLDSGIEVTTDDFEPVVIDLSPFERSGT